MLEITHIWQIHSEKGLPMPNIMAKEALEGICRSLMTEVRIMQITLLKFEWPQGLGVKGMLKQLYTSENVHTMTYG